MIKILLATFFILGFATSSNADDTQLATFAGGCFWCLQPAFDATPGVTKTIVGYTGGTVKNPTYEQVSADTTGHREVIQITYDPTKVSYDTLLTTFWEQIDPTQVDGQFADVGHHYTTAIYVHNAEQRKVAEASRDALGKSGKFKAPIATVIETAVEFYPAEEYHQKYYLKSKEHYGRYKVGSGRADFIEENWKKK